MQFERDNIQFNFHDAGSGIPFVYQHGLGGDISQTTGFFLGTHAGIRLLSMDCRGHGKTRPLGPEDKISMESFADDVIGFMDKMCIPKGVVGGISMGAAVALNLALRYPTRVRALVLQRPAWLDKPMPDHLRVLVKVGELIRQHGAATALELFKASHEYMVLNQECPDAALSTLSQFTHPRADETATKLVRIPNEAPCSDRAWKKLNVPALVIANRVDPIHPYQIGVTLSKEIPGAKFVEVTPKSVSMEKHTEDVRRAIEDFIFSLP